MEEVWISKDSDDPYIEKIISGTVFEGVCIISVGFTKNILMGGYEFFVLQVKTHKFLIKLTNHSFIIELEKDDKRYCYDIFSIIYGLGYTKKESNALLAMFITAIEDFSGQPLSDFTYGVMSHYELL